jgi:NarL family two-component system response regulator LiaR
MRINMGEQAPIRVIVVDDHPVVRSGIKDMLSVFDDIELVGEAGSGQDLLDQIPGLLPDLILMDLVMPKMDGLETTRAVLAQYPGTKIVILTTYPKGDNISTALDLGVVGFLTKHAQIDVLADAIRTAYSGQTVLAPEATAALMKSSRDATRSKANLTKRELEVLALLVEGLSNREIGLRLKISPETVKHHVSACISKLEVTNRTQAAALAIELQLVPRPQG